MDVPSGPRPPTVTHPFGLRQVYTVDLIPSELRQEELILRACDAFEGLEKLASEVFGRVAARIGERNVKLDSLCQRIDVAQAKIKKIKGTKKATKIFSSSKYPTTPNSGGVLGDFAPPDAEPLFKRVEVRALEKFYDVKEGFKHIHGDQLLEKKRQFFSIPLLANNHGQSRAYNPKRKMDGQDPTTKEDFPEEGLGKPPRDLKSVTSLLLFNTCDNPYMKPPTADPLLSQKSKKTQDLDTDLPGLSEAPASIRNGLERYKRGQVESFSYNPSLGDVPAFSVPDFLPDLAGIADDLLYTAELGPSIAPSFTEGLKQLELPSVQMWSTSSTISRPPPSIQPAKGGTPNPPPASLSSLTPHPPPPSSLAVATPPPPVPAPPPPPPPPPAIAARADVRPPPVGQPPSAAPDGRASLMEAIRGAGRAQLRNPKERLMERKRNKDGESPAAAGGSVSGGSDLMSDLAAKLQLRRKGLMGSQKESRGKAKDTLDLLMERVPVIPRKVEEDSDAGDEWK